MENISNENIQAVIQLADEFVKLIKSHTHSYDSTFVSIVKAVNIDGTYTIQDIGGINRKVQCVIPDLILTVGDSVWVKIPNGSVSDMHIYGVKEKKKVRTQVTPTIPNT